jgi:2-C-methyl-D-erythritol 2,4-cyclodiphosphate synthase
MRIGYGFDSDGDVLLHAITDALLGAVAAPDIGSLFSPSDAKWKNADSVIFLREALKRVQRAGYWVANLDSSLVMAAPKIGPHAAAIRKNLARLLVVPGDCIGLKAKTPEGLNLENSAIAHVVVLLKPRPAIKKPRRKSK